MSRPLPLLPDWLRAELAPWPGRWRQAWAMGSAATIALTIALGLQIASFPAPLIAFRALLPSIVCTWSNLVERLAIIVGAALVTIHVVGVVVQVPWLLVPLFVLTISVVTYIAPVQNSPVIGYCIALTVSALSYTAVFAPQEIGSSAVVLVGGFAIGLVVATAIAQFRGVEHPDERLSRSLSATFARAQADVRATRAELEKDSRPVTLSAIGPLPVSSLPQHVQLLSLARQERRRSELDRAFVALMTAAERIELYANVASGLARQHRCETYRRLLERELRDVFDAIDVALGRYADAARDPASVLSSDDVPVARAGPWPDFDALLHALRERQRALYEAGALAMMNVDETSNFNALTQALAGFADVLHLPPQALEHVAPEPPAPTSWLPAFDPYAAQYALKIGVGCGLALLIGVASHMRPLETIVLNPLLLAQGSYGATIRRADLRLIAVICGGVLTALTVVAVMPNTAEIAVWLVVFLAVVVPGAYVALGSPRFGYFGLQVATTYMIVMVANGPVVDIHHALWRFFGTLIGSALLIGTFHVFLPDYAGRQIISRFADQLRTLLSIVPRLGQPLPSVEQTQPCSDAMITALADILRLADEAWYEGPDSGIDRQAAVDCAGILRRIAHRYALIRRTRRQPRPDLPPALHEAMEVLERDLLERLQLALQFLDARHHRGRPGSRTYRAACAAAAAVASRPRPDLTRPVHDLEAAVMAARRDTLHAWPIEASSGLIAELGHLRRLAELVPALDARLVQMCLPAEAGAVTAAALRTAPVPS